MKKQNNKEMKIPTRTTIQDKCEEIIFSEDELYWEVIGLVEKEYEKIIDYCKSIINNICKATERSQQDFSVEYWYSKLGELKMMIMRL